MKILKPKNHKSNCSFRELIDIWQEKGYCSVEYSPDIFCWANSYKNILLYDYDTLRELNKTNNINYKFGLFANTVCTTDKCKPWIYFPKSPRMIDNIRKKNLLNYKNRTIESIFLGRIENKTQGKNRNKNYWNNANLEIFYCAELNKNENYLYSKEKYLEKLSHSKFGLCLPGFGPKCHREVELIGMGAIPIFTPGVDNTYHEPLIENMHYIYASCPEEIIPKIKSISQEKWTEMHILGQEWYERNISIKGSFLTTQKILSSMEENYKY
jgi:hypothetical protein